MYMDSVMHGQHHAMDMDASTPHSCMLPLMSAVNSLMRPILEAWPCKSVLRQKGVDEVIALSGLGQQSTESGHAGVMQGTQA